MENKKVVLPLISLFAALFLINFASAVSISAVSYPSTALHNSDVTVTFNVTYGGGYSQASITFGESTGSSTATWKTLPSNTTIANNSVPVSFTAVLNIPQYAAGTASATLKVSNLNTTSDTSSVAISIPINNTPSLTISNIQSITETKNGTINITNNGNVDLTNIALSATADFNVSFSPATISSLAKGASTIVYLNSTSNMMDKSVMYLGQHTLTILASSTNANSSLSYTVNEDFCDYGNVYANLSSNGIKILAIEDKSSSGNKWEWKPLEDKTIQVEVDNELGSDKDFVVELALYDSVKHKYIDLNGDSSLQSDLSINDGNSEKATFDFQVPIDLVDSDGRYVLYTKAYVDGRESTYCNSYAATAVPDTPGDSITITKKDKNVVLGDVVSSNIVKAGDVVSISARAFNTGSLDQDKVKVTLTNTKLGLNLESSSFSLDSGDSNLVDFSFIIPTTAENGIYTLRLTPYLDYKKSSDSYAKTGDSSDIKITITGGVSTNITHLSNIAASLNSEAKAGADLELTTTIKNLGSTTATFIVSALDYDSWATLNSVSDRILSLNAGESKDVTISLKVKDGVKGEQTFKIESRSGDKIDSKIVAVEIGGNSWLSSLASSFGSNKTLWIVGAVNVVLIVLIVFLALKVFRR